MSRQAAALLCSILAIVGGLTLIAVIATALILYGATEDILFVVGIFGGVCLLMSIFVWIWNS